jgi:C-terminal processing protease CtpA/Prc
MRAKFLCVIRTKLLAVVLTAGATFVAAAQNRPDTAETIVRMKPLKVMAEWLQIRPMVHRDGTVQYITITDVTRRSPAAAAGIRRGLILVSVQGVKLRGLTLTALDKALRNLPAGDLLELGVADPPRIGGDEPKSLRIFRLPVERTPEIVVDSAGRAVP